MSTGSSTIENVVRIDPVAEKTWFDGAVAEAPSISKTVSGQPLHNLEVETSVEKSMDPACQSVLPEEPVVDSIEQNAERIELIVNEIDRLQNEQKRLEQKLAYFDREYSSNMEIFQNSAGGGPSAVRGRGGPAEYIATEIARVVFLDRAMDAKGQMDAIANRMRINHIHLERNRSLLNGMQSVW